MVPQGLLRIIVLPALVGALITASCIKKPNPPSWDVDLNMPLLDTTYYVRDFLEDGPFSINPGDSVLMLDLSFELDTMWIEENLNLQDWDTTFEHTIGTFELTDRKTFGTGLALPDLGIPAWMAESLALNDSIYSPIPPISDQNKELADSIENLRKAYVQRGVMKLRLENDFPFVIDPFAITVYNVLGDTFELKSIDTLLPPDTSVLIDFDTSGVCLGNTFIFQMQFGTPGTPQPVWIKENDSIRISFELDTVEVESAVAYIDELQISDSTELFPDIELAQIDTAIFESGSIDFGIINSSEVRGILNITIPELELDTTLPIEGAQGSPWSGSFSIPLSGRSLCPGPGNRLSVLYDVDLAPDWYTLAASDGFSIEAGLRNFQIAHLRGTIDSLSVEIPEIDTAIDIPEGFQGISFHQVFLSPFVANSIGFEAHAFFHVTVMRGDETRSDTFDLVIPASTEGEPALWDTLLEISDLLEISPERIQAGGSVLISGQGTIDREDFVWTRVDLNAPLTVTINPDTIITDVAVDSSVIDSSIGETVKSGALFLALRNRLPLGIRLKLHVKEEEKGDSLVRVIEIPAAPVSEEGWSARDTAFTVKLSLSENEIEIFTRKPRKSWAEIIFPGTNGVPVTLRASDYMDIKGFAGFRVRIEE
ncbi:MAG: hypothetical protein DRQ06_01155 [Candidatus Hydrothermota bacterium]|nr:MAG: hypothetical protein DRQ06_01155 [Candidatus Hydrothermae bacterium]